MVTGDARALFPLGNKPPRPSLRIDRYIEAADGTKRVIDFKTSPQEGSGIEKFLDEQRARYAAQLDAYAEAVGGARRGLYFPLHKGSREW